MEFIAHIRSLDGEVQTVRSHLLEVKELAESFGENLNIKHLTGLAGILHDLGKFTKEFQNYILEAVKNPDNPPKRGSVDHSTAGGMLLFDEFHTNQVHGIVAEIVGNAIISHHSYLKDFLSPDLESDYLRRVRDKELPGFEEAIQSFYKYVMNELDFRDYVDKAVDELKNYLHKESSIGLEENILFLTKFIFSALIDADRTNTRLFEEDQTVKAASNLDQLFDIYYEKLLLKIASFKEHSNAMTPINLLRMKMSDQCDQFAGKASGIYTLSIPTGGGKTLASLRYALKHAQLYQKKRIIYVVPYTTIIEQNAEEVRRILQDDANILEHHSNVIDDDYDEDENQDGMINIKQKLKLAKDNWDSPIIFTTMVQFLNVFFAKGSRNIRRLHNLQESVIIFDEVQKVPISCVSLFNKALNFLKMHMKSSIVLCTATQPALDFVENKLAISTDSEMIDDLGQVIEAFKRVEIIDQATEESFNNYKLSEFIAGKVEDVQSVLIILNTKSVVKDLYHQTRDLNLGVPIYHLSTAMCPAHRNQILGKVRDHLNKREKVICISTQLIEAGVDVSFDCVIRSLAGLDSIAQAAGRCNRHGEHEKQLVYVIDHEEENLKHLKEIRVGKEIAKRILIDIKQNSKNHDGDILSKKAMDRYFMEFYTEFENDLNYSLPKFNKKMTDLLFNSEGIRKAYFSNKGQTVPLFLANSYHTAAEHFHVIENRTTSVLVPYGKQGKQIIAELNSNQTIEDLSQLLKNAQQYTINLYNYEKDVLDKNNGLISYLDGNILALVDTSYDEEFGLNLERDSLKPYLF